MTDYAKWDKIEYESDEDDCHPNIEINTWRRLKERQRREKGIRKKEPVIIDKWSTTAVSRDGGRIHKIDHSDEKRKEKEQEYEQVTGHSIDDERRARDDARKELEAKAAAAGVSLEKAMIDPSSLATVSSDDTAKASETLSSQSTADASSSSTAAASSSSKSADSGAAADDEDEVYFEARTNPTDFLNENMKRLRKYAKIKEEPKAHMFLRKRPFLIHEAAEGFLITFAVDRACEGASKLEIERLAMRCLYIHNLVEACKHRNVKPELGVADFYAKMSHPKLAKEYAKELKSQQSELVQRIYIRKEERLSEVVEIDESTLDDAERAPAGPGGLDPTEVLNSLPEAMQEAFLSRSVQALEDALLAMPPSDARYHMDRCIAAGLWEANAGGDDPEEEPAEQEQKEEEAATDASASAAAATAVAESEDGVPSSSSLSAKSDPASEQVVADAIGQVGLEAQADLEAQAAEEEEID